VLKEAEVTKDMPVETICGADPEETIDGEVARIAKEKWSGSGGSSDVGGVRGKTFDDGDQEGAEV
jgi:hypothetical protein